MQRTHCWNTPAAPDIILVLTVLELFLVSNWTRTRCPKRRSTVGVPNKVATCFIARDNCTPIWYYISVYTVNQLSYLAWLVCLGVEHLFAQSQACFLTNLLQVSPHTLCAGHKNERRINTAEGVARDKITGQSATWGYCRTRRLGRAICKPG